MVTGVPRSTPPRCALAHVQQTRTRELDFDFDDSEHTSMRQMFLSARSGISNHGLVHYIEEHALPIFAEFPSFLRVEPCTRCTVIACDGSSANW